MHMQRNYKKTTGFTLIEIMVVVVILGILAAIVVPRIVNRPEQARTVKAQQDIMAIQEGLELFKLDNGFYPTTDQGLEALVTRPSIEPFPKFYKTEGYIQRLPIDPWGRPYQYLNPGIHNVSGIDVFSYGPEGQTGTATPDSVIGNWNNKPQGQ